MEKQMINTQTLYNCLGWGLAIIFSAILNVFLFGIMPGMIQKVPQRPDDLENIKAIQVIRIKRPESPIRKKQQQKPEKQKQKLKEIKNKVKVYKQKPRVQKPRLAFELNPRLPAAVDSLEMPPMEHFSLNAPSLKGLYFASELDSPLTPLAKIPPIYPLRASRRGIEGWVKVQFIVNTSGFVENLKIIGSKPAKIFDRSVINCVARWKFKPGTVEGVPVPTQAETVIKFQLE
ncbi:MAG: energy transducer TonB [Deltaproteobacteria bacterium]|nr:MAG: energy transducer TonB [Deltaproteobacteria bacterium]